MMASWTPAEIKTLKRWAKHGSPILREKLPHRTYFAIKTKARDIGCQIAKAEWTQQDIDTATKGRDVYQVALELNRTPAAIVKKLEKAQGEAQREAATRFRSQMRQVTREVTCDPPIIHAHKPVGAWTAEPVTAPRSIFEVAA